MIQQARVNQHQPLDPCAIPGWLFRFALSQPILSPDLSFFLQLYFLPAPHPVSVFLFFLLKLFPPTYYPPLSPTDLLTYIYKLKVDSYPFTFSPIYLKCATIIPTHLPTPIFLPTNALGRYLSNPTYMVTPTYLVSIPIDPQ